ncbi:MAG TPA: hypothetical protein VGC45_12180 [Gryllotalpicola sp.]
MTSSLVLTTTIIGWCGAAASASAYGLTSLRGVPASSPLFQGLNVGGSAALSLSSAVVGAWPSATVNMIWFLIGVIASVTATRSRRSTHPVPAASGETKERLHG